MPKDFFAKTTAIMKMFRARPHFGGKFSRIRREFRASEAISTGKSTLSRSILNPPRALCIFKHLVAAPLAMRAVPARNNAQMHPLKAGPKLSPKL
jgi:hypothetical protein